MTKILWETAYPDEPYGINFDDIPTNFTYMTNQIDYDIQAASYRQMEFYYNVSLPHYQNATFLETAKDRYKKFLYLKKLNTQAYLVPTYDIDLIWHTHQLLPLNYIEDCNSYLGYVLNHDDTKTNRSPGSSLNESFEYTGNLWMENFRRDYIIPGVSYRGLDPSRTLAKVKMDYAKKFMTNKVGATLDFISWEQLNLPGEIYARFTFTKKHRYTTVVIASNVLSG